MKLYFSGRLDQFAVMAHSKTSLKMTLITSVVPCMWLKEQEAMTCLYKLKSNVFFLRRRSTQEFQQKISL